MSRWGNFLSGIESGLDKILADDSTDASSTRNAEKDGKVQNAVHSNVSRQGSTRRNTSRLQERLAKAVDGTPSASPDRQGKPRASIESQEAGRISSDKFRSSPVPSTAASVDAPVETSVEHDNQTEDAPNLQISPGQPSLGTRSSDYLGIGDAVKEVDVISSGSIQTHRDDVNERFLLERVEALQFKLGIFIEEATKKARDQIATSDKDTQVRRLAEKDEKISLLMAEGHKLSAKELKNLSTIRRLHARLAESDATIVDEKKKNGDLQREISGLKFRLKEQEIVKEPNTTDTGYEQLQAQYSQAQQHNGTYRAEIDGLRRELEKLRSNDLLERFDRQKQQSGIDQRRIAELEDELEDNKIERSLSLERHKTQLAEQKNKAVSEQGKMAVKAAELQAEIRSLESRLEAMRTRSEEVVGSPIEGQVKQLRQIEALQRQYSVSKENWNGIQASLNARMSALENERDDLVRREADLRRRLRDSVTVIRKREEELDDLKSSGASLEDTILNERSLLKDLQASLSKVRSDCDQLREELRAAHETISKNNETLVSELQPNSPQMLSPLDRSMSSFASRKSPVLHSETHEQRLTSAFGLFTAANPNSKRPSSSRKISVVSPHFPSQSSQRHQSVTSLTRSSSRSALRDSHSASLDGEGDDQVEDMKTPITPGQGFGEILTASASTPATGPSVQMVERMTSAVRRLESEKAAARDELERMLLERDEARKQIVSLLEEADTKRALEKRVNELETEVTVTVGRYQTTLELLGEKTETVEELKADIADMKHIYREALERSMK